MANITTRTGKGSALTHSELDNNFSNLNTDKAELSGADFTGNVSVDGNVAVTGTVDGRDVSADGTKLDGIEAGANVTDTANVVASLTAGTNITIASNGTITATNTDTQLTNEQVQDIVGAMLSGNTETGITVSYQDTDGTIDFVVNSQTDENFTTALKNKLDAIEGGATADQTAAEIRAAVEAATDSNVFTDADHTKLDGIEASADVTDTTNVVASLTAGTNITIAANGTISATSSDTVLTSEQVQDIVGAMMSGNTETGISVTYQDADGTIDFVVATQSDENFTATLKNKLDAIEASADVTDTTNVVAALTAGTNVTIDANGTISSTDTNTQLSAEQVQDIVGAMFSGNTETGIAVTYQDTDGTVDFVVTTQSDENFTTALKNKLDGIEAGADVTDTANVTAAGAVMDSELTNITAVKTLNQVVNTTSDVNFNTVDGRDVSADGAKLDTVEASANVTDTANVTAAGAVMDSELTNITAVKTLNQGVATTDSPSFAGLTVDTNTLKVDSTNNRVGILNASPDVTLDVGSATDAVHIPVGTTAQRPSSPAAGYLRYNSTTGEFEGYTTAWGGIGSSGGAQSDVFVDTMTGNGSTTTMTLTNGAVTERNTQVYIDGVYQNKSTYSLSGTTITFSEAPPNLSEVEVITIEPTTINEPADGSVTSAKLSGDLTTPGNLSLTGNASFGDNGKAVFGTSSDLQVYHSGTESWIKDAGTGSLYIDTDGTSVLLTSGNSAKNMVSAVKDGAVTLYNNNTARLATSSTGIDVTGTVTADGATIDNGHIKLSAGYSLQWDDSHERIEQSNGNLEFFTNNSQQMTISGGNVGIGITLPNRQLSVNDFSGNGTVSINASTTGASTLYFADGNTGTNIYTGFIQYNHSDNAMQFATNGGNERMRISGDGSLSTPTAGTSNVRFGANAGNSIVSGGNYNTVVGDEAGTAITTGDGNVALGYQAGFKISTGLNNVAIGLEALKNEDGDGKNTAVGTQALFAQNAGVDALNTAVGFQTGAAVTTGVANTLVGSFAGDALTDSDYNVAVGYDALSSDTLGSRSVAMGYFALRAQNFTSAVDCYNTAVGFNSGGAVTTGTRNTLIGGLAGDSLTNANYNTAVGFNSLGSATTSSYNTAIGDGALFATTVGDRNVAVGQGAMQNNTEGDRNTAVGMESFHNLNITSNADSYNTGLGFQSGYAVTTGIKNTFLGGLTGDATTTGFENVAIGYDALGTNTVGSHSVAIGPSALRTQNFGSATNAYNTAVGSFAGYAVTTGQQNTLMGGFAGDALTDSDYNTAIGYKALTSDTLGSRSTALGHFALGNQNFTSAVDCYNTAIGFEAGGAVTTGTNNTLIGGLAGDAITTGTVNVAVGAGALGALTTASYNTGIGYAALSANITGAQNTAVGYSALTAATGADNTAVGSQALSSVTGGTFNTAVGRSAGQAVTTGVQNTLMGGFAGDALTDSDYNVAIGYQALTSDTLGSYSTAIGRNALYSQNFTSATASHNTALGYAAGEGITTGVQNTIIGSGAGDAFTDSNNNVAVGFSALSANCGDGNTALGHQALQVCLGVNNTAVGKNAQIAMTNGGQNTSLGSHALQTTTTGTYNIGIGYNSNSTSASASGQCTLGDGNVSNLRCNDQSISSLSDSRDKTDVIDSPYGLDFINTVRPVQFKWESRDGNVKDGSTRIGFIAQELLTASDGNNAVLDLVLDDNPDKLEAKYGNLLPIAIQAIQDLSAQVDALTARIEALEG
jgi:hypothetical protein